MTAPHEAFNARQQTIELDGLGPLSLRMAYADAGAGEPVLLPHAIPTRSFLYADGYSQGAAVIDLITGPEGGSFGFVRPLPANVADRVAAVTVFGNPLNRLGRPLTAWSPVYGVKTIDLCNGADPVCSGGNDVSAHSLYVESGLADQAAEFVGDRLQAT